MEDSYTHFLKKQEMAWAISNSGIPKTFINKSLNGYGKTGKELLEIFTNPVTFSEYKNNYRFINIYGAPEADDLVYLMCRGFVLNDCPVQALLLGEMALGWGEASKLEENVVLGILGFYDKDYENFPLSIESKYAIEQILTKHLSKKGMIFVASSSPISEFKNWFSSSFLSVLRKYGKDFQYDARG